MTHIPENPPAALTGPNLRKNYQEAISLYFEKKIARQKNARNEVLEQTLSSQKTIQANRKKYEKMKS